MDTTRRTDPDLIDLELRLLAPTRTLMAGAAGGVMAILVYKTFELLARGFMGEGFQFSASERTATIALVLIAAALMYAVPSGRRETERLRRENDAELQRLSDEVMRIERERM
jgi:hypothetical protein